MVNKIKKKSRYQNLSGILILYVIFLKYEYRSGLSFSFIKPNISSKNPSRLSYWTGIKRKHVKWWMGKYVREIVNHFIFTLPKKLTPKTVSGGGGRRYPAQVSSTRVIPTTISLCSHFNHEQAFFPQFPNPSQPFFLAIEPFVFISQPRQSNGTVLCNCSSN